MHTTSTGACKFRKIIEGNILIGIQLVFDRNETLTIMVPTESDKQDVATLFEQIAKELK